MQYHTSYAPGTFPAREAPCSCMLLGLLYAPRTVPALALCVPHSCTVVPGLVLTHLYGWVVPGEGPAADAEPRSPPPRPGPRSPTPLLPMPLRVSAYVHPMHTTLRGPYACRPTRALHISPYARAPGCPADTKGESDAWHAALQKAEALAKSKPPQAAQAAPTAPKVHAAPTAPKVQAAPGGDGAQRGPSGGSNGHAGNNSGVGSVTPRGGGSVTPREGSHTPRGGTPAQVRNPPSSFAAAAAAGAGAGAGVGGGGGALGLRLLLLLF
eukprot:3557127-Rhodomonas_salina.1